MEITINGVIHVYAAGATVTVQDEVAALIDDILADVPSGTRKSAADELLEGVTDGIDALDVRVTALDDETDGAVPALDARVTALDDETDGAVPALDVRVTVLEEAANTADAGGSAETTGG
jgi:hypothetical protein